MKERMGLSLSAAARLAEMAMEKGLRHTDTAGRLKRYIDRLAMTHGGAQFRIYAQSIFVFKGGESALVTVLKLPNEFKSAVEKIKAQHGACVSRPSTLHSQPSP